MRLQSMQNVLEPRSRVALAGAAGVEPFSPKDDKRVAVLALVSPRPATRRAPRWRTRDGRRRVGAVGRTTAREALGVSRGDRVAP